MKWGIYVPATKSDRCTLAVTHSDIPGFNLPARLNVLKSMLHTHNVGTALQNRGTVPYLECGEHLQICARHRYSF